MIPILLSKSCLVTRFNLNNFVVLIKRLTFALMSDICVRHICKQKKDMLRLGLDVGSTTAKIVAVNNEGEIVFFRYKRHNARIQETVLSFLHDLVVEIGNETAILHVTGSIGMGLSERHFFPFVQEVVAASKAIQKKYSTAKNMIDIGGEDAKVVFFKNQEAIDLRMNGNCAGGTGAFIDQMACLLGTTTEELNAFALNSKQIHPIASRCGVFCKTDIQNLIAKNVSREDIAASIFHAIAVQTTTTLAHGCEIEPPALFCGGPLTFIPALRKAFMDYLSLEEKDIILPEHGELLPAIGTALTEIKDEQPQSLSSIIAKLSKETQHYDIKNKLRPIFADNDAYVKWKKRISRHQLKHADLIKGNQNAFIGIDSGSTTTKIVVLDEDNRLLYSFYKGNGGNPIKTVTEGLELLKEKCTRMGTSLHFLGGCSTGYGEDLIKTAFGLPHGIVETMAHYMAAQDIDRNVSFILDIGGQDMKAIFVNQGIVNRIEINEACSSGCGSFIETFAKSLGYSVTEFAEKACCSQSPCDLGTRCTVFMNSKVKQVLREGSSVNDISAGLAYSVIKNCLYKVLKLKDTNILGKHIVVQGGTMRNDAVVRVLEILTGQDVSRCDCPELMGAYGCALFAAKHSDISISLDDMLKKVSFTTCQLHCKGCENQCLVQCYQFNEKRKYFSGNRCEKIFCNDTASKTRGNNAYLQKRELLFSRHSELNNPRMTVGIPRALNMFEEYPFWHTLFTSCGIEVHLSSASKYTNYEKTAKMVMSDNICFPAKLVHSHIEDLAQHGVDRIFMPFVVHERKTKYEQNSYNCPIVTGYSTVVKSVHTSSVPIDSPIISFKERGLLFKQCCEYLSSLGIDNKTINDAFHKAEIEQEKFHTETIRINQNILQEASRKRELCILLAGRPYHTDELIQHKVSDMLSEMGIHVLTDDVVRKMSIDTSRMHLLSQWSYPNRILKAAQWTTSQSYMVQFVQITSFGCGPDAFITDEIRDLLVRHNRSYTILKMDDINNIGSMKLRVRSLIESLRMAHEHSKACNEDSGFQTTPTYGHSYRKRKILIPYFTSFISPLIPSILKVSGYEVENLPLSDEDSCEWGLRYANNEVCYPATLIVGDIIKAFKSGKHLPSESAVAITQTGGQCRASNYLPMIKRALIDAGYTDVPVISLSLSGNIENNQPAFKINWLKILPIALRSVLYSDCISKFYYASVVRENKKGAAIKLRDMFLRKGCELIETGESRHLYSYLALAAKQFNEICVMKQCGKVGVVGEIYLKFNPFAQRNILDWLIGEGVEIVPPNLTDFFMQAFVNRKINRKTHLLKWKISDCFMDRIYKWVQGHIDSVNEKASAFRYFSPLGNIWDEAKKAQEVIPLNAQFGEGWLLPAEIISYAQNGVNNIISLQPFGCIANQIVSKGIEKKIKQLYSDINLLSLDFDSGVSDANIRNRILLFIDKLNRL